MGLLQTIADYFIRSKVTGNLRQNCPASVKNELETLLSDKDAAGVIRTFIMEAMKNGGKFNADSITGLPFPERIQTLLSSCPKLVSYLAMAARMAGRK